MVFKVLVEPRGKARPRFSRRTNSTYTTKEDKVFEKQVREAFIAAGGEYLPAGIPVYLCVTAWFTLPKSATRNMRRAAYDGEIFPLKRPDGDNILKAVQDALNGVAYHDDSQIQTSICEKYWCRRPEEKGWLSVDVRAR